MPIAPKNPFLKEMLAVAGSIFKLMPKSPDRLTAHVWLKLGMAMFTNKVSPLAVRPMYEDERASDKAATAGWWYMLLQRGGFVEVRREITPQAYGAEFMTFRESRSGGYQYVVFMVTDDMLESDHDPTDPRVSYAKIAEHAMMQEIEILSPFEALYFFADVQQKQNPDKEDPGTLDEVDIDALEGKLGFPYGVDTTTHDDDDRRLIRGLYAVKPGRNEKGWVYWEKLGRCYTVRGIIPGTTFVIGKKTIG